MSHEQIEMISLDDLVPENHAYRKMKELVDFRKIIGKLKIPTAKIGAIGYTKRRLVLCLILQFLEDLSDRELEKFLQENTSGKFFCEFSLREKTPDYSLFSKFRSAIGLKKIEKLFRLLKSEIKTKGYMAEEFTFVDSTALVSKFNLWEERDKSKQAGYEKLNNKNIEKFSNDKEAKIGCKNKNKYWYGFKNTSTVDMESGMITDIVVTAANVADADAAVSILPKNSTVFGDKGFVGIIELLKSLGCIPRIILRDNMKEKDLLLDKIISEIRAPFERIFSNRSKRVRYKGIEKNQMSEYLFAFAFNLRRLVVLTSNHSSQRDTDVWE